MFCQNSPPWSVYLGCPCTPWLIDLLSYTRLWSMWSFWLAFCDCDFCSGGCGTEVLASSVCPLMGENKRLVQAFLWEGLALGKMESCSSGQGYAQFSSAQSLSFVWLFATPWTTTCQASLSIANSRSLLKLMSIMSVMPSNHLILCRPLLLLPSIFPSIRVFPNESVLCIRWPKYWVSASASSVLPMNIQDWFPLGWTGWISLYSKEISSLL